MVKSPECKRCVHNEVCKLKEDITNFINTLHEDGLNEKIPESITLTFKCDHCKFEMCDYVC